MRNHTAAYKGGKKAACRSIERRGGSRSGLAMQRLAVSLVRIGEIAPGWGGVDSERAVEIGVEAECFNADLVVMPPARRPSAAAWISELTRRLLARRPASEIDVLRVWVLRPEPLA